MTAADGTSVAEVGDVLTYSGRDWYTYTLANSTNVSTIGMTIHSSSGFTVMELDGECGHTFSGLRVVRKPGYMIASNADVFHSSDCANGVTLEDSVFEANLDDFYNIHSTVHVGFQPSSSSGAAGGGDRDHHAVAVGATVDLRIIQPRLTATSESVNRSVTEFWYGTASPMSAVAPGDTLSCWTFNSLVPILNLSLAAWPQELTNPAALAEATALQQTLNGPPTNAGLYRWVSLRLWSIRATVLGVNQASLSPSSSSSSSSSSGLPVGILCDLDRFQNVGVKIRNNIFRNGGHPQIGGRLKGSGAVVENNRWEHNEQLNVEVSFLQSWMEGPTHISDVLFRNNSFVDCIADHAGPVSAQPGSFFALCGAPSCSNIQQVNNSAVPPTGHSPTCDAAVATWRKALGARIPLASLALSPPFSFKLGGIDSSELLATWDCGATDTASVAGNRVLDIEWMSPDSFIVKAVVTFFLDTAAVDALISFRNDNETAPHSLLLTEACALDASWQFADDATIETLLGSESSSSDFTAQSHPISAGTVQRFRPADYWDGGYPNGTTRYSGAGRSSNGQMPFWHIESESLGAGVTIGLGWSGQWNATIGASGFDASSPPGAASVTGIAVRATASLEDARFVVLPGESMRSLRILVSSFNRTELASPAGGYAGEPLPLDDIGRTVLRRIILAHYAVKDAAGDLIFPKIAALGYPHDVVTDGHAGELWSFYSITAQNQLSIMKA